MMNKDSDSELRLIDLIIGVVIITIIGVGVLGMFYGDAAAERVADSVYLPVVSDQPWCSALESLPNPQIQYLYSEDIGNGYERHWIGVTNWDAYPENMFLATPWLGPCGLNTNPGRTWVKIRDASGNHIYGYCGIGSPEGLIDFWFAWPLDEPVTVYVDLVDRKCEQTYSSQLLEVPQP
jgi:hypothetical protein